MCSRYAETQCCVCCRFLDQSNSRIIVEICGHQKCRECFIKEEDGCSICARNKGQEYSSEIANRSNSQIDADIFEPIPSSSESARADEKSFVGDSNDNVSHIITTSENGDEVRYKCTICQKSFKSRNNRKYHVFCDKTRSKPFQCKKCDKQFITLAHMNYHTQSTHNTEKSFACTQCHKIYSGPIALKKHMKKHQNDFKYQCSQCNEKFLYKEQLNIHQNRHNNVFHKCPECGKRFLVKSNLTKHIQSHSGLNRRVCQICKNSFSGNSALKTHMLTHSKSKPHQCEKCSKKFIDQRTLERHWKTHLDNLFYECTLCSAKSGRKDNIRRHVRNLHSESDEELQQILDKIFDNFEKRKSGLTAFSNVVREEKTEKSIAAINTVQIANVAACAQELSLVEMPVGDVPVKPSGVVRNIATSVIKFVGRSQDVSTRQDGEYTVENPIQVEPESVEVEPEQPSSTATEHYPIAEIGVNLPSLEPLNFDAFPSIAPLPLINTNTNLTVYRQLLSPYLKKQPDSSCSTNSTDASTHPRGSPKKTYKLSSTMVIDRPPKKMIEKYEFYRS